MPSAENAAGSLALVCPYCGATLMINLETEGRPYLTYEVPESIECYASDCGASWEPNGEPRDAPSWVRLPGLFDPPPRAVERAARRAIPPAGRTNEGDASSPTPRTEEDVAGDALRRLLAELPAEFSQDPATTGPARHEFRVIKQSNVSRVHHALWDLQRALGYDVTCGRSPGEGDISA